VGAIEDAERSVAAAELHQQAALLHEAERSLETGARMAVDQLRQVAQTSVGGIMQAGELVAARLQDAYASARAIEDAGRSALSAGNEASAQMEKLVAVCTRAEEQAALLPGLTQQIGAAAGSLQASARAMPSAEMLTGVMHALGPIAPLAADMKRLAASTAKLERIVLEQIVPANAAPAAAVQTASSVGSPLRSLGGVEREAAALMAESEALAEAVLSGRVANVPPWLCERTAEVLSAVEMTIHRLRSVATAIALASDAMAGSKPRQAASQA
jgi:hypothetical protein